MHAGRVPGSGLEEPLVRLLVERGVREVDGGHAWSSDPRLTLPTLVRMTEAQVENLVAGIECPTLAIFAEPAQPYLPDDRRRRLVGLLPRGELAVIAGGHHLHMQQPGQVDAAIGDFFLR
jgi:pimeloyl-ACP methyl ester carboxylesterase